MPIPDTEQSAMEANSSGNDMMAGIVDGTAAFKPALTESTTGASASVISFILFAVIGYFAWRSNIRALVIISTVIFIHELGHLLAMKLFNYKNLGIFFIPLFGGAAKGTKTNVSQKQEAIVLLAGPLPGILIGAVLFLINKDAPYNPWIHGFSIGFIFINLLNLLPVYPLDGGRLLQVIFLSNSQILSTIFSALSILVIIYFSITRRDYIFLVFGLLMISSLINSVQKQKLLKLLKEEGIEPGIRYDELNKEQYSHVRQRMVQHLSAYKQYDLFEYDINSVKEKALAKNMEQLLKAAPANDMKLFEKVLITGIWLISFAIPFVIDMRIPFLNR